MKYNDLTRAERIFRGWMLICAIVFGLAVPFFLLAGVWIVPVINAVSARLLPLPLYPLPASGMEGAFWRVLGVSMMAMLTWACTMIYLDVRRNHWIVGVMLISKFCSTFCYSCLFVVHHEIAYLGGALTDGPIFLVTLVLWFLASPGTKYIDSKEESILLALGETIVPHGGAFSIGFSDVRDECLAEVRGLLATLDPVTLVGTRLLLRAVNFSPVLVAGRLTTITRMPQSERAPFLVRLENSRISPIRAAFVALKVVALLPFFNLPEAERAVGYVAPGETQQ